MGPVVTGGVVTPMPPLAPLPELTWFVAPLPRSPESDVPVLGPVPGPPLGATATTMAMATLVVEVDLNLLGRHPVKPTTDPLVVTAVVQVLAAHPAVRTPPLPAPKPATVRASTDLRIAVDVGDGTVNAVICQADDLSPAALARALNDVTGRAATHALTPEEQGGGTFAFVSGGHDDVLLAAPSLADSYVAVLGAGSAVRRPSVVTLATGDEGIAIRPMSFFALTYDSRHVGTDEAALFLSALKRVLEDPSWTGLMHRALSTGA